jgi:hypothetical protein
MPGGGMPAAGAATPPLHHDFKLSDCAHFHDYEDPAKDLENKIRRFVPYNKQVPSWCK